MIFLSKRNPRYRLPTGTNRNWFTNLFEDTLNLGFSVSFVVVGKRTGISKTYGTARMAELLDPYGFTAESVEKQYLFYAQDYIKTIRTIKPFQWIIFDEPGRSGSGGSKQEWQTHSNRALSSTCQISRFKTPVSAFIIPHKGYIASQIFGLAQVMLVFTARGFCKVYHIEVSEFDGKVYTPYMGGFKIGFPSSELIEAIEARKDKMWFQDTERWGEDIDKAVKKRMSVDDIAKGIIAEGNIEDLKIDKLGERIISAKVIKTNLKVSHQRSYDIKYALESMISAKNDINNAVNNKD